MAYKKKVWKTGDIMKQEDINNIENGIYEAHQELKNLHNYDDTEIKTDINTIKTDLGTEELTTTAKDVKGAVNEVAAQYKDIANKTMTNEERNKLSNLENYDDTKIKASINTKADKNEVFTMANMGQDIKEAMTGGSVPVVGENSVGTINLQNNSVSEEKMSYIPQNNFLTNGLKMYAGSYDTYFDIRITSDKTILYYYDSLGKLINQYTLTTKQYDLPNYNSLIWDLTDNTIKTIADGQNLPDRHVKLLHNSVHYLDSGVLLEYVFDKDLLYKSEGAFCYFEKPESLYISTRGVYTKTLWLKWEGSVTLKEAANLIITDTYDNISAKLTTSNSLNENPNCITLEDGACLAYEYSTGNFCICKSGNFNYKQHILLLRNTNGCAVDGLFINHINNNIQLDTDINFTKIPRSFNGYIESKKIEVLQQQNENTVCLAHISDIHTTEFTGYRILQGVNILNEFANTLGIQAIINTGDNILYENKKADALGASMRVMERTKNKSVLLYSIGNHDSNGWDKSDPQPFDTFINDKELYAMYGQKMNDYVTWGDKIGMYYYYDVPNSNVRIITLNSCDVPYIKLDDGNIKYSPNTIYNYSQKQIDFLISTLSNSFDKHIIIDMHVPLLSDAEGIVANYTMPHNNECVLGILQAFKNGTTYTYTNAETDFEVNVNCKFDNSGTIIGVFSGHVHYDCLVTKDGINHIAINCDYMNKWTDSQPDRIFGTTSEFCFDVLTIDTKLKKCNLTRVGVGENREFTY